MLRSFRLFLMLMLALCFSAAASFTQDSPRPELPLVVGYFPGEGFRKQYFVKNLLSNDAVSIVDQINYSQGHISGNQCAIADANADLNYMFSADESVDGTADTPQMALRGNFHQLQELKRIKPSLKIVISLEGKAERFAEAAQPTNRHDFVASCIETFIKGRFADGINGPGLFDGIDVDWEYPEPANRVNFIALLGEFRRQLNTVRPNLLLTVAMGDGRVTYEHLDMRAVSLYADEIGVMNYDYSGPWSKRTGLIAPLYSSPGDPEINSNVDATIRGYEAAGVPASKILMGLPFYAYSWNQVAQDNHGLFQLGEPSRIDLPYSYIASIQDKFTIYRDPNSKAPWLFDGNTFWTFDDDISIGAKLGYAREQALGGVMIWELSGDTTDGKLLTTVSRQFKNYDPDDEDDGDNTVRETP